MVGGAFQPMADDEQDRMGHGDQRTLPPGGVTASRRPSAIGIEAMLRKAFSFPAFIGAMVSVAAVAATVWRKSPIIAGKLFVEGDTWWHLAVGERILSTHTWPTADPYSFTMRGAPWIAYEWLGEVVMAIADRLGGLQGLAALLVLLAITLALLIYYYAWLRSGNPLAAGAATVLVMPVVGASLTMRPQVIGFIFLTVTLIYLERYQQGRSKSLWILPVVFLVWVNTHGSFILGFLVLGLYWVSGLVEFRSGFLMASRWTSEQRRHLLAVTLLCLVAVTLTPYGTQLAAYPLELVLRHGLAMRFVVEWQPLSFAAPYGKAFLFLLLVALLAQVASPVLHRLETLVLVMLLVAESCLHARFIIIFAIVFAPVLASLLACWLPRYRSAEDHPVVNGLLVAAVVVGVVALFPSRTKLRQMLARNWPVGAVQYLRRHPVAGNMFNTDLWGSYLIWAMPGHGVFIDGRFDIYEYGGVLLDFYKLKHLRGNPHLFLGRYDINSALVQRGTTVGNYFAALPGWHKVYEDRNSVIFTRLGPPGLSHGAKLPEPTRASKPSAARPLARRLHG